MPQFSPTARGLAYITVSTNASIVCPESIRPDASEIVIDMISSVSHPAARCVASFSFVRS